MKNLTITLLICLVATTSIIANNKKKEVARNPLVLNGQPLDYGIFSAASRGKLTVTAINAAKTEAKVPFRIYLKRGDVVINRGMSSDTRELKEIYVEEILNMARFGDKLVVEYIQKEKETTKCVIVLEKYLLNLFGFNKKNDGC